MIGQNEKCVECKACVQKCPTGCISFTKSGELSVDYSKCIHCNLCETVCQLIQKVELNPVKKVYAALCCDTNLRKNSSSGGIAQVLYQYVLEQHGVVFGAKYNHELVPVIDSASNKLGLESFRHSKYAFSDTNNSFVNCKEYCDEGRLVLYIGLPCQIAGLKLFLGKDYDNLVLIDILCHGAPHYSIFKNHINYLSNKHGNKVIDYEFRNKKNDQYGPYCYEIHYEDGKCETGSALWDAYYKGFLDASFFRKNCYECCFASATRVADISLGDFWTAFKIYDELKEQRYISSILVNTEKGQRILRACQDKMILYDSNIERLAESTHAVSKPANTDNIIDDSALKDSNSYYKWAKQYEHSISVKLRKIKFRYFRRK